MKTEIEQFHKLLKGINFNRYHQSIADELQKEKPFRVKMPAGSNIYYCHTWELEPETIEKARSEYQTISEVRHSTYNLKKAAYLKTFERPGSIEFLIESELETIADILQNLYKKLFYSVQLGYFVNPDQYHALGELWAYCDLYTEFYEMLQAYQAGNFQTGFTIDKNLNLRNIFHELQIEDFIHGDYRNFQAAFTPLPLPVTFVRVRWIKQNQKNKYTAKKALIDLLRLMKVPDDQIENRNKIAACFADAEGQPLQFTGSNFSNNKDFRQHSDFYHILQKMIV